MSKTLIGLSSFRHHMTDESWQLQEGLAYNGWNLCGPGLKYDSLDVEQILECENPDFVIIADEREWNPKNPCCLAKNENFYNLEALRKHPAKKFTILKDVQHATVDFYKSIGFDGFIVYYNPSVVCAMQPYVWGKHLYRTYHSVNANHVPPFARTRRTCLLSGATSQQYYPLRHLLFRKRHQLLRTDALNHPGYNQEGPQTPRFLQILNQYKVAICTASIYDYALRKIIEASACGCIVITNLTETLPEIDDNLIRVRNDASVDDVNTAIKQAADSWDVDRQINVAERTKAWYNYLETTKRLDKVLTDGCSSSSSGDSNR